MKWEEIKDAAELDALGLTGEFENSILRSVRVGSLKIAPGPYGSGIVVYKPAMKTVFTVSGYAEAIGQVFMREFEDKFEAEALRDTLMRSTEYSNVELRETKVPA